MSGPLYRLLAEDHARLDRLLQDAMTEAGQINHAAYAEFRAGLLRHISMEEKLLLPPEKSGGRPRKYPMREVINAIQYVLRGGCAWRLMPHDLPHWQTAYQTWRAWRHDGTWLRIHDQLRDEVRMRMGRHPQPSAAIIDAQTVKTTEKGGRMGMTARRSSMDASAISSLIRRVSSCVSSSIPPV